MEIIAQSFFRSRNNGPHEIKVRANALGAPVPVPEMDSSQPWVVRNPTRSENSCVVGSGVDGLMALGAMLKCRCARSQTECICDTLLLLSKRERTDMIGIDKIPMVCENYRGNMV